MINNSSFKVNNIRMEKGVHEIWGNANKSKKECFKCLRCNPHCIIVLIFSYMARFIENFKRPL